MPGGISYSRTDAFYVQRLQYTKRPPSRALFCVVVDLDLTFSLLVVLSCCVHSFFSCTTTTTSVDVIKANGQESRLGEANKYY